MTEAEPQSDEIKTTGDTFKTASPGMVARHLKDARDFANEYLKLLSEEIDDVEELKSVISLVGRINHLIQFAYDENNQEQTEAVFGAAIRNASGKFVGVTNTLMYIAELAKYHLEKQPLTDELKERYPTLTIEHAGQAIRQLQLSQIYCGFHASIREGALVNPALLNKMHNGVHRAHNNVKNILEGQQGGRIGKFGVTLDREDQPYQYCTYSPSSRHWKAGQHMAREFLQGAAGERIADVIPDDKLSR